VVSPKTIAERLLDELDAEAATTRKVLERVPDEKFDWQPHPKSMPMGRLAGLVATMPAWIAMMLTKDQFDVSDPNNRPPAMKTSRDLVATLDRGVAESRDALKKANDAHFETKWRMLARGHVVSEQSRYESVRTGVLNHLAHHRGQLTVYLRLNDVPVPSIYGPTADEGAF
jgi:uncharacterized damage-inducible protein DinB